jgi:hypothetical protein
MKNNNHFVQTEPAIHSSVSNTETELQKKTVSENAKVKEDYSFLSNNEVIERLTKYGPGKPKRIALDLLKTRKSVIGTLTVGLIDGLVAVVLATK